MGFVAMRISCFHACAVALATITAASAQTSSPDRLACSDFLTKAASISPNLKITTAEPIASDKAKVQNVPAPVPAHCRLVGALNERVGLDGKPYAIGFEMRLPLVWNHRFFYQANGGNEGSVVPAFGGMLGGGPTTTALSTGFAVVSANGGHEAERDADIGGAVFGLDPQARLDYGYNTPAQLTPVAKEIVRRFYGEAPHRSYMVGSSNGGRHGLVTAVRLPDAYDGILAGAPGYNLPRAAVQHAVDTQAFAAVAPKHTDGRPIVSRAFSSADLALVAGKILARCDELDGASDGIVADRKSCQSRFSLETDIPSCRGEPDGTCLRAEQKAALVRIYSAVKNSTGQPLYSDWSFDPGISAANWRAWKLGTSETSAPNGRIATLGAASLAYVFTTPPTKVTGGAVGLLDYLLSFDLEKDSARIFATDDTFKTSAVEFMTPPSANLTAFRDRGGKLIVFHGNSDPVFSVNDTIA
jgi:Tannase and feruloyl esterase